MKNDALNVMTSHAEIEGMAMRDWFGAFLDAAKARGVRFVRLADEAAACLRRRDDVPVAEMIAGEIDGRTGTLALQGAPVAGLAAGAAR